MKENQSMVLLISLVVCYTSLLRRYLWVRKMLMLKVLVLIESCNLTVGESQVYEGYVDIVTAFLLLHTYMYMESTYSLMGIPRVPTHPLILTCLPLWL